MRLTQFVIAVRAFLLATDTQHLLTVAIQIGHRAGIVVNGVGVAAYGDNRFRNVAAAVAVRAVVARATRNAAAGQNGRTVGLCMPPHEQTINY